MCRFFSAFVVGALCVLLVAPAAIGKEGVQARLDTPVPLDASPGKTITIAWSLSEAKNGRPFGASGVFVRLQSASGGESVKAVGRTRGAGRYIAEARVPDGGIGGVKIGLEGIRIIGGHSEEADIFFPITNYPITRADASAGDPLSAWLLAAAALATLGAILTAYRAFASRRRHTRGPVSPSH